MDNEDYLYRITVENYTKLQFDTESKPSFQLLRNENFFCFDDDTVICVTEGSARGLPFLTFICREKIYKYPEPEPASFLLKISYNLNVQQLFFLLSISATKTSKLFRSIQKDENYFENIKRLCTDTPFIKPFWDSIFSNNTVVGLSYNNNILKYFKKETGKIVELTIELDDEDYKFYNDLDWLKTSTNTITKAAIENKLILMPPPINLKNTMDKIENQIKENEQQKIKSEEEQQQQQMDVEKKRNEEELRRKMDEQQQQQQQREAERKRNEEELRRKMDEQQQQQQQREAERKRNEDEVIRRIEEQERQQKDAERRRMEEEQQLQQNETERKRTQEEERRKVEERNKRIKLEEENNKLNPIFKRLKELTTNINNVDNYVAEYGNWENLEISINEISNEKFRHICEEYQSLNTKLRLKYTWTFIDKVETGLEELKLDLEFEGELDEISKVEYILAELKRIRKIIHKVFDENLIGLNEDFKQEISSLKEQLNSMDLKEELYKKEKEKIKQALDKNWKVYATLQLATTLHRINKDNLTSVLDKISKESQSPDGKKKIIYDEIKLSQELVDTREIFEKFNYTNNPTKYFIERINNENDLEELKIIEEKDRKIKDEILKAEEEGDENLKKKKDKKIPIEIKEKALPKTRLKNLKDKYNMNSENKKRDDIRESLSRIVKEEQYRKNEEIYNKEMYKINENLKQVEKEEEKNRLEFDINKDIKLLGKDLQKRIFNNTSLNKKKDIFECLSKNNSFFNINLMKSKKVIIIENIKSRNVNLTFRDAISDSFLFRKLPKDYLNETIFNNRNKLAVIKAIDSCLFDYCFNYKGVPSCYVDSVEKLLPFTCLYLHKLGDIYEDSIEFSKVLNFLYSSKGRGQLSDKEIKSMLYVKYLYLASCTTLSSKDQTFDFNLYYKMNQDPLQSIKNELKRGINLIRKQKSKNYSNDLTIIEEKKINFEKNIKKFEKDNKNDKNDPTIHTEKENLKKIEEKLSLLKDSDKVQEKLLDIILTKLDLIAYDDIQNYDLTETINPFDEKGLKIFLEAKENLKTMKTLNFQEYQMLENVGKVTDSLKPILETPGMDALILIQKSFFDERISKDIFIIISEMFTLAKNLKQLICNPKTPDLNHEIIRRRLSINLREENNFEYFSYGIKNLKNLTKQWCKL